MQESKPVLEHATVGGGCFWCIETLFGRLRGVHEAVSGYAGGHSTDPTYEEVCSGETGHAEVVRIAFDPSVMSYAQLLELFFAMHDPTTKDRQGNDIGTQYRSIILTETDKQREIALAALQLAAAQFAQPIVTTIEPLQTFYPAEAYHQDYFNRTTGNPYCSAVVAPKVASFMKKHAEILA